MAKPKDPGERPMISAAAQARADDEASAADPEAIERFKAEHEGMEPFESRQIR